MDNLFIEYVEVNQKRYKLQHPGNREVLKLYARCTEMKTGMLNMEKYMDFCFENVVFPEGHSFKPTIDNLPPKEFEEWFTILPRYLRLGEVGQYRVAN